MNETISKTISFAVTVLVLLIVGIVVYGVYIMPDTEKINIAKIFVNILAAVLAIAAIVACAIAIVFAINLVRAVITPGRQFDPNSFAGKIEGAIEHKDNKGGVSLSQGDRRQITQNNGQRPNNVAIPVNNQRRTQSPTTDRSMDFLDE